MRLRLKRTLLLVVAAVVVVVFQSRDLSTRDVTAVFYPIRKPDSYLILDFNQYYFNKNETFRVGNCIVTRNKSRLHDADAVAVTTRKLAYEDLLLLSRKQRPRGQKWVFVHDESGFHVIAKIPKDIIGDIKGVFNWTMTYRTSSDVPIPYGTSFARTGGHIPGFIGSQPYLAVAMMSNCMFTSNRRLRYVNQLRAYMPIKIFGACGDGFCEGYEKSKYTASGSCRQIRNYKFYLAFENSNCDEYVTEKVFMNGLAMGAVPVVLGARRRDYEKLLPPNSFIYAADYKSPEELADYLKYLSHNTNAYMRFHEWRKTHSFSYRLQYLGDEVIWKPLCDSLNADDGAEKTYKNIFDWWNPQQFCQPPQFHKTLKKWQTLLSTGHVVPNATYKDFSVLFYGY